MSAVATANERFKQASRRSFWVALIAATLVHAAVLAGSPIFDLEAQPAPQQTAIQVVPPEARLPEAPPPIRHPAAPVISAAAPPEMTLDPVTPQEWRQRPIDPPPPGNGAGGAPPFTPMEVAPRLLNGAEVERVLLRQYPPILRHAGVGGVVSVWFHIDERGTVVETRIHRSSGYDELDRAALAVADAMEFSPALNRERRVPVWVSIDVLFEVR